MPNFTRITGFILAGLSDTQELQTVCGVFFLVVYLIILMSNFLIITLITLDLKLQTPMYFFLKNLSLFDVFFVSVPIPSFFVNSLTHNNFISIPGCAFQVLFMTSFSASETIVLTAMSYDRYVAICCPLHYEVIMSSGTCSDVVISLGLFCPQERLHRSPVYGSGSRDCKDSGMPNITAVTEFILMGFSDIRELQTFCGVLFLVTYMAALVSNLVIITLISLDLQLQTPMYFFLKNLSLLDAFFVSVPIPKFFVSNLTHNNSISIHGCVFQVFLMTSFAAGEVFILTVMSYDRYVAICSPLHYQTIMSSGFLCVALEPILKLARIDQAGLKLTEIRLPLPLEH
ncbi:hypothetical protein U0070_011973 [Myodes glareolus]|uniref:G-protein coupled receptors family 1 profile domain-containing protein n=1 Tax=Myodes glareolus TaxID=447135 RepID=A0AAW0I3H8_MYOGA